VNDRRDVVELYFLRHAHAGDAAAWSGTDDERPLTPKGERQAERLGRFLGEGGLRLDAVATSPKVRAARTAEIVARHLGMEPTSDERLGRALDHVTIEAVLFDLGEPRRVMLVGHDPDFTELVSALAGAREIPMKKGALARVDAARPLEPGGGVLRWLIPPDLLPG
jgi:phosphohistidine phosphatase